MTGVEEGKRTAHFETCAVLIWPDGHTKHYTGKLFGKIAHERKGNEGFGYDPIFIPDFLVDNEPNAERLTVAQLGQEVKNQISHRTNAIKGVLSQAI